MLQIVGSVKNPKDDSKPRLPRIGCKKSIGGCGTVRASAAGFESEVITRLLDRAVEVGSKREREAEELRNSPDSLGRLAERQDELARMLADLEHDFYSERMVSREGYLRSRSTLLTDTRDVAAAIESAQAEERRSAFLEKSGPDFSAGFDEMPIESRIKLTRYLCERIVLHPAKRRGGNVFQKDRVEIVWNESAR